jgi:deoxyribodipyrimidine photolyase-related protein
MNCLSDALRNSLDNSYAHHIQRLMVISNFALLAGIEPAQVNEWYLGVYADAIEWVQLPNTHGMGQYADGGIMATKPYVSSANYINKMSDHCKSCVYNLKNRIEQDACPFNSLYYDFYLRHEKKLGNNPRIGFAYMQIRKMKDEQKKQIKEKAKKLLNNLEGL